MHGRLSVDVDLPALAAHLSSEDEGNVSIGEARQWLRDAGFEPHCGRWLVDERNLGQLDPSEVRSITRPAIECSPPQGRITPLLGSPTHHAAGRRLVRGHRRWLPSRRRLQHARCERSGKGV